MGAAGGLGAGSGWLGERESADEFKFGLLGFIVPVSEERSG